MLVLSDNRVMKFNTTSLFLLLRIEFSLHKIFLFMGGGGEKIIAKHYNKHLRFVKNCEIVHL